jgi:hypothetical protein
MLPITTWMSLCNFPLRLDGDENIMKLDLPRILRLTLHATLVWFLLLSPAMASEGETAATWVSAAVTACGLGWLWRRTVHASDIYDVWYGTNRKTRISNTYDNEFGNQIHYGKCKVSIPKGHVFGSIGSSPFRRWFQRLMSGSDDSLRVPQA